MTETKPCTKCELDKPFSEFNKNKNNKDGLLYYCKECVKVHYIDNNKAKLKERYTKYYQEHKDALKEYYQENKERLKEQQKINYNKRKDNI